MSAASLLDELEAAGVRLTLAGNDLRYHTRSGVSIAPHVERLTAYKSVLVRELLHRRIGESVDTDPQHFDREQYDQVHQQLKALPDPEEEMAELVEHLEAGWRWMDRHPDHPEHERFLARWLMKLHEYERAYAVSRQRGTI